MSTFLVAAICVAGAVVAFGMGYAYGNADALETTGTAFREALGKVVEMTSGLLEELEKRQP